MECKKIDNQFDDSDETCVKCRNEQMENKEVSMLCGKSRQKLLLYLENIKNLPVNVIEDFDVFLRDMEKYAKINFDEESDPRGSIMKKIKLVTEAHEKYKQAFIGKTNSFKRANMDNIDKEYDKAIKPFLEEKELAIKKIEEKFLSDIKPLIENREKEKHKVEDTISSIENIINHSVLDAQINGFTKLMRHIASKRRNTKVGISVSKKDPNKIVIIEKRKK